MSPRGKITTRNPETGEKTEYTVDCVLSARLNKWLELTEDERDLLRKSIEQTEASGKYPSTVGDGSCVISINGVGSSRTIDVTATITGSPEYVKNIQVTVKRVGNSINIISWSET